MPLIEFHDVYYTYDGESFALSNINFSIEQGEFVCVLGGNGSGKSTLAKHINALLLPDQGSVKVLGKDTQDQNETYYIRSHAGMVFQNPDDQLVASLVENDVAFGPENLSVPTDELRIRVADALANVGLQGFDGRETASLSGGQKQRVAIAGVLAMKPEILILDEATAMLDPRGRKGLMRVCRELNADDMTIIMITHYMDEAAQADRIIVLDGGEVACIGSPQDVLTQHELLERLHLDLPFAAELSYALAHAGIDITATVNTDELKEELCALALKA